MDSAQLDDLKQFIDSRISQSEVRIKDEIRTELRKEITGAVNTLRQEMQSGFEGVGEAIERLHTITDNHETRITALEQKPA